LEQKENRRSALKKANNGKVLKERHIYQGGTMKERSVKEAGQK
jgi:hypothetical protein